MTLVLSVQQICKLVRLVPPSRVLLRVRCYPHNRQINSIDYKKVQQVCNAVRENHNIKEIVLNENPIRVECEQILFDQLPDRIVQMTCKSQTCSKLLNRQCLMEKLILSETYSDENILYFNHVFQLKTRKIKLRTYFYSDIPEALPLKQNESIEVIKIDIFNLFDKDKEYWYRSYKPHYAAVFRTLRTINDKLILQLSTEFRVDDMNIHISDHNQLKEVYQEGLSKFRALIDSAADAKLPICKVSIRIQDRGLYYRWKDVSEQRSFFTSQSHIDVTGEWEPTEDGEEMSIDTRFLHNYKQTKFITKAFLLHMESGRSVQRWTSRLIADQCSQLIFSDSFPLLSIIVSRTIHKEKVTFDLYFDIQSHHLQCSI
ncbi:hypothetical protein M3Y94_00051500 [Aphelenchoides besseyi]|nr:hypothetical protein M3Y94_00051500 [Aphelenchoides besseyi]